MPLVVLKPSYATSQGQLTEPTNFFVKKKIVKNFRFPTSCLLLYPVFFVGLLTLGYATFRRFQIRLVRFFQSDRGWKSQAAKQDSTNNTIFEESSEISPTAFAPAGVGRRKTTCCPPVKWLDVFYGPPNVVRSWILHLVVDLRSLQ